MRARALKVGLAVWLCTVVAGPLFAAARAAPAELLLQDVVRLEALPHSAQLSSQLQLLHTLIEIDLGLTESAAQRLAQIQGSRTVNETVEQLRLLLALRYWQEGEQTQAVQWLEQVKQPLPGALEQERVLLQALRHYAAGDPTAAIALINHQRSDTPFLSALSLDLALMLLQTGETEYALDLLQLLGNSPAADEVAERLRERANLVLARTLLASGQADAAQGVLERLRLDGPDGSAALLLLGWIKLELAGPEAALVPWMELSLREANDPAVLEGRLALPMALTRRGPDRLAFDHFNAAIDDYQQRLQLLDGVIAELAVTPYEARWQAQGVALGQGGSVRAMALLERHATLLAMAERWPVPASAPVDGEALRAALLNRLRGAESAALGSGSVWRELYGRLGRYLIDALESERSSTAKQPFAAAAFEAERAALRQAAGQQLPRYRNELLAALQQQRRRVAGYLDQARFMVAKLHELALLQQLEGR